MHVSSVIAIIVIISLDVEFESRPEFNVRQVIYSAAGATLMQQHVKPPILLKPVFTPQPVPPSGIYENTNVQVPRVSSVLL